MRLQKIKYSIKNYALSYKKTKYVLIVSFTHMHHIFRNKNT